MAKSKKKKTCFVISPIGEEGSEVRRHADCVLEYIVKPALDGLDYEDPVRVDKLDKSAHITTTIIQYLVKADMVVADLTGLNPNVFYELGIRHANRRPCIMLSNWQKPPPFDVSGATIIRFIHDDPFSHSEAARRIRNQIEQFEKDGEVSNPVTVANAFTAASMKAEESGDKKDKLIVEMMVKMEDMGARLSGLENKNWMRDTLYLDPQRIPGLDLTMPQSTGILSLTPTGFSNTGIGLPDIDTTLLGIQTEGDDQDDDYCRDCSGVCFWKGWWPCTAQANWPSSGIWPGCQMLTL